MKALSLFTGIGGLDLAAERCGIEPVAFCEIEPYAQNKLIGYLTNGEVIKQTGDGWSVFDNTFLSVLLTMR